MIAMLLLLEFQLVVKPICVVGGSAFAAYDVGAWVVEPVSDAHRSAKGVRHGCFSILHSKKSGLRRAACCLDKFLIAAWVDVTDLDDSAL